VLPANAEQDADKHGAWEYGLLYLRTEIGHDTPDRSYDRSQLLFAQLSDAIAA